METKIWKKLLAVILAAAMIVGLLPAMDQGMANVQAEGETDLGEVGTEANPYPISSAEDLKEFAQRVNNGERGLCAILIEPIDLNPGYTFTFQADTGLTEVTCEGKDTFYLGMGVKGDLSGEDTNFDETASERGAYYTKNDSAYTAVTDTEEQQNLTAGLYEWTPMAVSLGNAYTGTFDGNGKTISGMYRNRITEGYVALFGIAANGAKIKNVNIMNSYLSGKKNVASIIGSNSGTITGCSNTGIISGDSYVGGLTGQSGALGIAGKITDCFNTGEVVGNSSVGGLAGMSALGSITDCFNIGTVAGNSRVGGLTGQNVSTSITGCYNIGEVAGTSAVGSLIGGESNQTIQNCVYLKGSATDEQGPVYGIAYTESDTAGVTDAVTDFSTGEACYLLNGKNSEGTAEAPLSWYQNVSGDTKDEYPVLDNKHGTVYETKGYNNGFWGTVYANAKFEGADLEKYEEPAYDQETKTYQIKNAGQLAWFSELVTNSEKDTVLNAKLMENIDLNKGDTFDFQADTGLVEVTCEGKELFYLGTGVKGDLSGEDINFDETASERGAYYTKNDSAYAAVTDPVEQEKLTAGLFE